LLIFNRKSISITALGYLLLCLFRGSYLADAIYKKPVLIHSYPKEAKPFYVRVNDDKTVAAFDLFVPKVWPKVTAIVVECVYMWMD
jgi:hypothetical protein